MAIIRGAVQCDLFAAPLPLFDQPARSSDDWIAPQPDWKLIALLEQDGRSPFSGEDDGRGDEAQWQSVADETMCGLIHELIAIARLDELFSHGQPAFRNARAWEQFQRSYPPTRQAHVDGYEATLDAIQDVWGFAGRDIFDQEARRRGETCQ